MKAALLPISGPPENKSLVTSTATEHKGLSLLEVPQQRVAQHPPPCPPPAAEPHERRADDAHKREAEDHARDGNYVRLDRAVDGGDGGGRVRRGGGLLDGGGLGQGVGLSGSGCGRGCGRHGPVLYGKPNFIRGHYLAQ